MTLSTEQLALRKSKIGGSDAAEIICGSAMRVYYQKTSDTPLPQTERMELGNQLEPIIAALYERKYGVQLFRPNKTYISKTHDWMIDTPDGLVLKGEKLLSDVDYGVEIKMVGQGMTHEWGKDGYDIPQRTVVQGLWGCDVLQVDRWDIGALLLFEDPYLVETGGGDKTLIVNGIVRFHTIRLDPILMDKIREICHRFLFDHVLKGVPPRPDGRETTKDIIRLLTPERKTGELEKATPEEEKLLWQEIDAKARYEHYKLLYEQAKQTTEIALGDRPGVYAGGVGRLSLKKSKDGKNLHNLKPFAPVAISDEREHPVKQWWED